MSGRDHGGWQVHGTSVGAVAPRLALSKGEAAEALGVSVRYFREHVMPELAVIRRGRRVLVPVSELERWVRESAALTLGGER